ncbi:pantetheine-phosphate adenylyltransferase [Patescibacteria group bacterium AH-259-L07]|nr:pantetheine-phosphate adenylyltransferase [Patescibacteria group bacterium AH-259-L07]
MKEKLAVYAGTFDPLTNGHLWMIEQGVKLFDRLVVAIGINPEKQCMFSVEERLEMIRETTQQLPNLEITTFNNQFLVNYAQSIKAQIILRGIRSESGYEYERVMRNVNSDLSSHIISVFLMPPREIAEISSSMVKGLIGPEGWEPIVQRFVPKPVFEKIKEIHHEK